MNIDDMSAATPQMLEAHAIQQMTERVRIAHECHELLQTSVGKHLTARLVRDWLSAIEDFEKLADDEILSTPAKVLEIKRRMDLARTATKYLSSIVREGRDAADELLRQQERNGGEAETVEDSPDAVHAGPDDDIPSMAQPDC